MVMHYDAKPAKIQSSVFIKLQSNICSIKYIKKLRFPKKFSVLVAPYCNSEPTGSPGQIQTLAKTCHT